MLIDSIGAHLKLVINTLVSLHLAYCSCFLFVCFRNAVRCTVYRHHTKGRNTAVCMAIL